LTTPSGFLSNNSAGGLDISNVSAVGNTISFYVNINCAQPVKLSSPSSYLGVIQTAYNNASSDATLQTLALTFNETLLFARAIPVAIRGGYDCAYSSNPGWTIVTGSLTIRGGPVTLENLIIK
jgi:hypothetical protein